MRKYVITICIILLVFLVGCTDSGKQAELSKSKVNLDTELQKKSYSMGYKMGMGLTMLVENKDIELDPAIQGVMDAARNQPKLPIENLQRIYTGFNKELKKRNDERKKAQAHKNKVDGENFLKANVLKEGVITTDSGLQYQILREGTGLVPKESDIAIVNYIGYLWNGKEIFNTYKLKKPVKLPVKRSLPVWREGLKLMKVGSRFRFFIPPDFAYRSFGKPPIIGPNSVLVYDAELMSIEKPEKQAKK
jgi:FKBP-type peptidyl-prolyl cis-trans isomerase FkpA